MSRQFSNYILAAFLPTECVAIEEIAKITYANSLKAHPNDGWKPLEAGQQAPLPFLAHAIGVWQSIKPHLKPKTLRGAGQDASETIRFSVAAFMQIAGNDLLTEDQRIPRIPLPGDLDRESCHLEEWYEATLVELDAFVQDWRAKNQRPGEFQENLPWAEAYPLETEPSDFDEGFICFDPDNEDGLADDEEDDDDYGL